MNKQQLLTLHGAWKPHRETEFPSLPTFRNNSVWFMWVCFRGLRWDKWSCSAQCRTTEGWAAFRTSKVHTLIHTLMHTLMHTLIHTQILLGGKPSGLMCSQRIQCVFWGKKVLLLCKKRRYWIKVLEEAWWIDQSKRPNSKSKDWPKLFFHEIESDTFLFWEIIMGNKRMKDYITCFNPKRFTLDSLLGAAVTKKMFDTNSASETMSLKDKHKPNSDTLDWKWLMPQKKAKRRNRKLCFGMSAFSWN